MKIEFNSENINVREIMAQIKEKSGSREYVNDKVINYVQTEKGDFYELENNLSEMNKSWHYTLAQPIESHRKLLGKAVVLGKRFVRKSTYWLLNPTVEKQVKFNADTTRALNEVLTKLIDQDTELKQFKQNEGTTKNNDEQIELEIINNLVNQKVEEHLNKFNTEIEILKRKQIEQINKIEQEYIQKLHVLEATNRVATERLKRIERSLRNNGIDSNLAELTINKVETANQELKTNSNYEFDYFLFEEYYRGSRETIKERMSHYVQYFEKGQLILDLGCGRGEMTELLLENGKEVVSVDLDADMVQYCKDKGFNILQMDILSYLNSLEDNSVDGIFLGQVIEHLSSQQLIDLMHISYKKLKPLGRFIAETPNPQSLSIFTQSFYMDLTHTKPVHPYTAKFILESAGFGKVEYKYSSPNDEQLQLPKIELEGHSEESLTRFNETIKHWNNTVFGYQDYAVIATK